jgi:hypothetical protein
MKEDFEKFVQDGMKFGIVPEFQIVNYSEKKGIIEMVDGAGHRIIGKRCRKPDGTIGWSFRVLSS